MIQTLLYSVCPMQRCGDVTMLQYITIDAAKAAAERLAGRPVGAPAPASVLNLRSAPRARPVPRAAAAVARLAADLDSTAADDGGLTSVSAAAAGSIGAGAGLEKAVPAERPTVDARGDAARGDAAHDAGSEPALLPDSHRSEVGSCLRSRPGPRVAAALALVVLPRVV